MSLGYYLVKIGGLNGSGVGVSGDFLFRSAILEHNFHFWRGAASVSLIN